MKTTLSPMFIGFDVRQGERELDAQQVVRERAESRNFGRFAHAIHRAGRKVWATNGAQPKTLHVVANRTHSNER